MNSIYSAEKICGASMKMPKIIRSTGSRMFIEFKLASGARFWTPGWSAQHRGNDVNDDICLIVFNIIVAIS